MTGGAAQFSPVVGASSAEAGGEPHRSVEELDGPAVWAQFDSPFRSLAEVEAPGAVHHEAQRDAAEPGSSRESVFAADIEHPSPSARNRLAESEAWEFDAFDETEEEEADGELDPVLNEAEGLLDAAMAQVRDVVNAVRSAAPATSAICCDDATIARRLGITIDGSRNGLLAFDGAFSGPRGASFRARVTDIARRVNLDPGLLVVNFLAEVHRPAIWMSAAAVESPHVGVDYWHEERGRIQRAVPAAAGIRDTMLLDSTGKPIPFINEVGNDTGPIYRFSTGEDAMLAVACAIAYREVRLRGALAPGAYDRLSPAIRFTATRLAFNAGLRRGMRIVQHAAAGRDPLIRRGPTGPKRPTRTATVRAGQAIHISRLTFGNRIPCP